MKKIIVHLLVASWLASVLGVQATMNIPAHAQSRGSWAFPGAMFLVKAPQRGFFQCSVGFPAEDVSGNHYFITAGHCFRNLNGDILPDGEGGDKVKVYIPSIWGTVDPRSPVGYLYSYPSPRPGSHDLLDIAVVKMYPNKAIVGSRSWPQIPVNPIAPQEKMRVCVVGTRESAPKCGNLTKVNISVQVGGSSVRLTDLTGFSVKAQHGDSGGPVYSALGAVGILSSQPASCMLWCDSFFVPLVDALAMVHQHIPSFVLV